jgi:hypothetical protein
MRKQFETVKCTVLLAASEYTSMLEAVDTRLIEHQKSQSGPLMRISGESHDVGAVLRSRWHLHEFITDLNLPTATVKEDHGLDSLDLMLQDRANLPEPNYVYESSYYSIRILMSIYEDAVRKFIDDDMRESADDWVPPENFADGTDDEQEVWQSHQAQKTI